MQFLTTLLEKLFGLSGKAQVAILVLSHILALVVGLILGMAFAKPTIVINKDGQAQESQEKVIWGSYEDAGGSTLPSSSSTSSSWQDFEYRTQLLQLMPPSPAI